MSRFLVSKSDRVREKDETTWRNDYRMSGGDQMLSRHAEIVAFLAKCYAEEVNERRRWPMFDVKRLGQFLGAAGIDVDAAIKTDADAMQIPDELTDMEVCINKMHGASFLTEPTAEACVALKRRDRMSNSRRGTPAANP